MVERRGIREIGAYFVADGSSDMDLRPAEGLACAAAI